MSDVLNVHVAQMNSVDSLQKNLEQIFELLDQVPNLPNGQGQPQLVCFPENCLFLRLKDKGEIPAINLKDSFWMDLQKVAQAKNAVLHFGSVPLKGGAKLLNSSVTLKPGGVAEATYAKIHLFDIDVDGHKPMRESENFQHGQDVSVLKVGDWSLGQSICYDLRFSELYAKYAKAQVDALLVPAAFLVPTGKAHWETLLRARAIESQCYVIAAAQAGEHKAASGETRNTYGHSLVVGPWGDLLSDAGATGVKLSSVQLSRSEIQKVRRQIPMADHRRL